MLNDGITELALAVRALRSCLLVWATMLCWTTCAMGDAPWLTQGLSRGFGIVKLGDEETVGRFGGGAWGRVNGADFDGDGDLDLIASFGAGGGALGTYSGLWIYRNIGTSQQGLLDAGRCLAPHGDIEGAQPRIGDANKDGRPDVFCNGLLFLNRPATGHIAFGAGHAAPDPYWPGPGVCDWNGDGVLDRLLEDLWRLKWFNGKTGVTAFLPVGDAELLQDIFIRPYACDWDADGDLDVLVGQESGHISFIENQEGRLLAEVYLRQADGTVKSGCASVPVICDWDGDADADLVVGTAAGFIELYECQGGQFEPAQRLRAGAQEIRICAGERGSVQGPQEARWGYLCPEVADWDLDGDLDILAGCVTGENLFFENIGTRTRPQLGPVQKLKVDWGDGRPVHPEGVRYAPEPDTLVTQWRCRPVVLDWNADGLPDYLTVDEKGTLACYLRFRRAQGDLGLKPASYPFRDEQGIPLHFCTHERPGRNGRIKFALVDWDLDGDLDLIRSSGSPDGKQNLDNGGSFVFLECLRTDTQRRATFAWRGELFDSREIRLQGHTSAPFPFDIDGNGTRDIVSGCEDGNIYWFTREWIESRAK